MKRKTNAATAVHPQVGVPMGMIRPVPIEAQIAFNSANVSRDDEQPFDLAEASDEVLENRMVELNERAQKIEANAKAAGRETTDRENRRVEAIFAEFDKVEKELDARSMSKPLARKTQPDDVSNRARDDKGPKAKWKTPDGRPIYALTSTERLASLDRGAPKESEIPGIGQVIRAMATNNWDGINIRNALSEGIATDGGYTVNPYVSSRVIDLARDASVVMRAGAQTVSMPTSEMTMLRITEDPEGGWVGENQSFPETGTGFGALKFKAKKLGALIKISSELIEDSPNAESIIESTLATAMGQEVDRVALLGQGGPEDAIVGLFGAPGVQTIPLAGSPPEWDWDTLLDAIAALEGVNASPNAYIINAARKRALAGLKNGQGDYLPAPADVAALTRLVTNKLSTAQAAMGDFSQMMVGVRTNLEIAISRLSGNSFEKDQVWIRARWRGDVQFARPSHLAKILGE